MRYLEEINTGYISQHLGYMKPQDAEKVRKQATARSGAYDAVSVGSVRELVFHNVVKAWFESWYWRMVVRVSYFAERNINAYTQGSEREENWFYNHIITRSPALASSDELQQLQDKLNTVFSGGDFSRQEIGDKLIAIANEAYSCGVIGASAENGRGLRAEWRDNQIVHALKSVNEPWY